MSKYIVEEGGKYFLVNRHKEEGKWVETQKEITNSVVISKLDEYTADTTLEDQSVYLPCFNPECKNTLRVTVRQKRDLLLSFQKKYQKVVFVACSPECQAKILQLFNCTESDLQ